MVVEEFPNFGEWLINSADPLQSALLWFVAIIFSFVVVGVIFGYLVAAFRHGPFEAFYVVAGVIYQSVPDLIHISPRRVFAIAKLAAKEAFRRRVIIVAFVIFSLSLLFGGWFLNSGTTHPERVVVGFVMFGTQLLVLMLGVLISAFSLPEDITNRTIYTVVTKPVRASEIILGRVMGFVFICTVLLAAMALVSYVFVWRALSHSHEIAGGKMDESAFQMVSEEKTGIRFSDEVVKFARTTYDSGHSHVVELAKYEYLKDAEDLKDKSNVLRVEETNERTIYYRVRVRPFGGHTHDVSVEGSGEDASIKIGPELGFFRSREPLYARSLVFLDRRGQKKDKGINVGEEWQYRGYVEGGTASRPSLSAAEFIFDGVTESQFSNPDDIKLEMTLRAFRTHKGDINRRVMGSYQIETVVDDQEASPKIYRSAPIPFESEEFSVQVLRVPRTLDGDLITKSAQGQDEIIESGQYDFFEHYANSGQIKLILRCNDPGHYLGVAQADVYFRTGDSAYWSNFLRGYFGIWLQLVVIVSLGVVFSTFLGSPVTIIGIITFVVLGFYSDYIGQMTEYKEEMVGGGPIESLVRLVTQKNMMVPLGNETAEKVVEVADRILAYSMYSTTLSIPDLRKADFSAFVQYGYGIDSQRILVAFASTMTFAIGVMIAGYYCLKTREIAK